MRALAKIAQALTRTARLSVIKKGLTMTPLGRGLRYHFKTEALDDETFNVIDFVYHEQLSTPFEVKLILFSRYSDLTAQAIVDQTATLSWYVNGESIRHCHGIVSQFIVGDTGHRHTQYQITLVPAMSRLKLRHNSRIYQQQSAVTIINSLLNEMGISDVVFAVSSAAQQRIREYCVQYSENDFDFISRLAAEEGLFYYFEQTKDKHTAAFKHTLVFCDNTAALGKISQPFPYIAATGGVSEYPYVRKFSYQHQIKPNTAVLKDYSFKKPAYSFLHKQQGRELAYQQEKYEHFDFPGRYKDDQFAKPFVKARLEYLRTDAKVATAHSNIMTATTGVKFTLSEHLDPALNRHWLITGVKHTGLQGQGAEGSQGVTTYNNEFTAIAGHLPWQAQPQTKPVINGTQIAIVVGPPDEEIYCDEYGRVKIQFPWDRYGQGNDKSSCWVRVSQGGAGAQYGSIAIPRIGHEVIVSFLEGDPDQPIIIGRSFHAVNLVPYPLPANKTRTVIKTKSHKSEGSNELRFDDATNNEEIYLHGQKDLNILIENDRKTHIKHDQHINVDHDRFTQVNNNDHLTVQGNRNLHIKGMRSEVVDKSLHIKQANSLLSEAGQEVHLKAGNKIVIEAGVEITIKAGGSFVKIDPAGVHLSGPGVNLNSGGSAGGGSGYGGTAAILPLGVAPATMPQDVAIVSGEPVAFKQYAIKHKIIHDLQQDTPLTQICQKQTDGTCPLSDCPCGNAPGGPKQ